MNKKGFTLVELLATLVVLGIVVGLAISGVSINTKKTKEKTEKIFIGTIEDALEMYIDSDARKLSFSNSSICTVNKSLKKNVGVYKTTDSSITLSTIINSTYSPLDEKDLVNPNNKEVDCNPSNTHVDIYRDEDYVYYYRIKKEDINCLTLDKDDYITNLPSGCSG